MLGEIIAYLELEMIEKLITSDMIIAEILERWPQTIPVFSKHNMGCVGCAMASFETLSSALVIYKLPGHLFLDELHQAIYSHTRR